MGNSKILILIDGHALAFRQYYALNRGTILKGACAYPIQRCGQAYFGKSCTPVKQTFG